MRRALGLLLLGAALPASAQLSPAPPAASAGFTIDLTLSERAAAELARRNEGVVAAIWYRGEALPAHRRRADEEGMIFLGEERIAAAGRAGPILVTGRAYRRARSAWIRGPAQVTVNLFSARRSDPNNLLECGLIDAPLPQVAGRRHALRCALIGER